MRRQRFLPILLALAGLAAVAVWGSAPARAATAPPGTAAGVKLAVLSDADVKLYRDIFKLQEQGRLNEAAAKIKALKNDVLLGHVLFQKYMHPTAYRSSFRELQGWLADYADHPDANRVYILASKRRPSRRTPITQPERRRWRVRPASEISDASPPPRRNYHERRRVRQIEGHVRALLRRERPTQALNYIESPRTDRDLTRVETDYYKAWIAQSYFIENVDQKAFALANDALRRGRKEVPLADWTAGLAAWRLGKIETATKHFEVLSKLPTASKELKAAAAYWAARGHLRQKAPQKAIALWSEAAEHSFTFYGLLAARQLGRDLVVDWSLPDITQADIDRALQEPALARAVALAQVGQFGLAEDEFARAHGKMSSSEDRALLTLAHHWNLPSAQILIGEYNPTPGLWAGLYPLPDLRPDGGFILDRALVLAFIRQESRFRSDATSRIGAQGIMQVMPRTASYVTKDASYSRRDGRDKLLDPGLNMKIGQQYLTELMDRYNLNDNLFHLMAAYNGGPGNLRRWLATMDYQEDPLLFIESIPSGETRNFVERVLTNFWLYRLRLGQSVPSLDRLASGDWPTYHEADGTETASPMLVSQKP